MTFNRKSLVTANDRAISGDVLVGALLYQNSSRSALPVSFNSSTFVVTFTATGFATALGKRVTLTGTVPTPLQTGTFFMIPVTATSFKLASSLDNALTGTEVTWSPGSYTGSIYDESITADDTVQSLVSYELSYSGYARQSTAFATSVFDTGSGQAKAAAAVQSFANASGGPINVSHALGLIGGSLTPGSTSCAYFGLINSNLFSSVANGETVNVNFTHAAGI